MTVSDAPNCGITDASHLRLSFAIVAFYCTCHWNICPIACLKEANNCLNTNIYSYLETSGGQSSNRYLYVVYLFNTGVNLTFVAA
jgi:hypothetical protein